MTTRRRPSLLLIFRRRTIAVDLSCPYLGPVFELLMEQVLFSTLLKAILAHLGSHITFELFFICLPLNVFFLCTILVVW